MLSACYGISSFCVYLGCAWSLIYGSIETFFLFGSILMLFMTYNSHEQLIAAFERGGAVVPQYLFPISGSYFLILSDDDPWTSTFVRWFMRFLNLTMALGVLAAMIGPTLRSFWLYILISFAVCTGSLFALIAIRGFCVKQKTRDQIAERGKAQLARTRSEEAEKEAKKADSGDSSNPGET